MSPEQAIGHAIDSRSDVYGLGCVLYEMLTGEQPFTGASSQAVLARSLAGDFRPVRSVRPDVPPAADASIRAALSSAPEQRPPSAGELLSRFTTGGSSQ
jgi:serine/threonine-protein kinase